jgi:DNA-directed RNA polymerase II subunit RPB2
MDTSTTWKIIDSHFRDNAQSLVRHHVDSYNDFYKTSIFQIFREKNPVRISSQLDEKTGEFKTECNLYFGGKSGNRIYFGKPVIYDDENAHYMFPNEARLRNMTYGMTIHYDVEVEFIERLAPGEMPKILGGEQEGGIDDNTIVTTSDSNLQPEYQDGGAPKSTAIKRVKKEDKPPVELSPNDLKKIREATERSLKPGSNIQTHMHVLEKIYLGKFPIMLQSDFCILKGVPREVRHTMGECRNDLGGYFIIDGKEKTVIAQEKFADNMLYIREVNDEHYLYSAEMRSVSENVSKPIRTVSVKMVAPSPSYTNRNIVVNIPNVRKPVPLFIVFRALGVISDKEIISFCLLDMEKYESMIDLFIPSVHDAATVLTQHNALKYIATFTKGKTVNHALEILADYFLPHVGEINYIPKAYALGHMVFRLLSVYTGIERPTDRDNFKYKRLELVGSLLYDLFREYWSVQLRQVHLDFEKTLYYSEGRYENDLYGLITQNYRDVFKERALEQGFRKAFKGNWGAHSHTKRIGVIQDLNRLSFNSALNHLRKTNLPLDSSVKLVGPRVLHNSQWGFIDPIDTPDGASIGLHKHLAIMTYITRGASREPMIAWLREKWGMKLVEEFSPKILAQKTKVLVNGYWAGVTDEPVECVRKFRLYRRNALIPIYASATFEISLNTIFIYTDAGRLCRPIFYRDEETGRASYQSKDILKVLQDDAFTWDQLVTGFNEKRLQIKFDTTEMRIYELTELYEGVQTETNPAKLDRFIKKKAVIDYIDTSESENAMIALDTEVFEASLSSNVEKGDNTESASDLLSRIKKYTHCEIHESLLLGMMCNMIIFPENNPASRNSFSCGQSKQAVSLYHTNYQVRMDKTSVLLNYGQIPLVKSRFLEHIQHEENPYGENAIVAIMCYTGYNVEDAVLINEGAIQRGLFRTSYFSCYEAHEETTKNAHSTSDKRLTNIEAEPAVLGLKSGYDYSKLDKFGVIREGELVDEKTILIGLTTVSSPPPGSAVQQQATYIDGSKGPKKGQLGVVDRTFITEGEEGNRIAKVRVLEQRVPAMGDKMASRSGQKGTIGMIIPERDMPFTKDGIRPDLIINPHAIPTRMTIGQLVECITGKACAAYGGFGDCTAFVNKGSKIGVFGEMLTKEGFHSSGSEILYNGMTGEQLESEIFMGPTYYMRLKHMVKDKINFRALGPRTALTKQPVSGRANDGGLRVGEMERDSIISHGATEFLRESMMERGDKSFLAICNKTGMISIYNPSKNLFMSPMADGPLKFTGSLESDELRVEQMTKFGRSFSVICIPYSLKLLIQELSAMQLQMRIITEDNLEQVQNMSYSKNIDALTGIKDITPKSLIAAIKKQLQEKRGPQRHTPPDVYTKTPSPDYPTDVSPAYQPSEIDSLVEGLDKNTDSPIYNPLESPEESNQKIYSPHSPEDSPPPQQVYSPHSPEEPPPPQSGGSFGGSRGGSEYAPGDRVMMRGVTDGYADRLWEITKVGDKFLTAFALDPVGLSTDKQIRVVKGGDVFRPTAQDMQRGMSGISVSGGGISASGISASGGIAPIINLDDPFSQNMITQTLPNALAQPNIIIAPKFFNGGGSDNSTELQPADIMTGGQLMQTGGQTGGLVPTISSLEPVIQSNTKTVSGGGEIDFSRPLVVKKA